MNLIKLVFNMIWHMEILKDIKRRTASDEILREEAFTIAKNPKYDGYQRGLPSMVYRLFDKSPQVVVVLHALLGLLLIMIPNKTCN